MIGSPTIIMGVYLLSITNMLYQKKVWWVYNMYIIYVYSLENKSS